MSHDNCAVTPRGTPSLRCEYERSATPCPCDGEVSTGYDAEWYLCRPHYEEYTAAKNELIARVRKTADTNLRALERLAEGPCDGCPTCGEGRAIREAARRAVEEANPNE